MVYFFKILVRGVRLSKWEQKMLFGFSDVGLLLIIGEILQLRSWMKDGVSIDNFLQGLVVQWERKSYCVRNEMRNKIKMVC